MKNFSVPGNIRHAAVLVLAVSVLSTSADAKRRREEPAAAAPSGLPSANDTARFLAGMPLLKSSPLAPLTSDPAWQDHAGVMEASFAKLNRKQLIKLHAWEVQYFPASQRPVPVVFYMFSGPDFLYVDQFFPKASTYILCGKESMGPPPDPLRVTNMSAALHNLESTMYSSLRFSFFITKDMKVDLQSQHFNGTLPVLYVFLARANKSITDISYGSLNEEGAFREGTSGGIPGVRINYTDNRSRQPQTLFYFNTDISDGGIGSNPGFLRFCEHHGVGDSFLKASSYLMFEEGFNRIRNFILDHSKVIVQDDAGVPLANFNPNKWNVRVFGNYIGPTAIFKQHYQARLMELYHTSSPPPLAFNFGYRWNYKESNLMVVERQ